MVRKVLGNISERIYAEVGGENVQNDMVLAQIVERHLASTSWKAVWISEGFHSEYAKLFIGETNREAIFMWVSWPASKFYLVDARNIAEDPVVAMAFAHMVANYFLVIGVTGRRSKC